ncbi:MAG: GerMN domain-containing protein [Armatimonadetes bacterium]|nr:GerMN domain-containing protein [Armatimonadota bacterium]
MSQRPKRNSYLTYFALVALAGIILVLVGILWRIYPEYRDLKESKTSPPVLQTTEEPEGEPTRRVVAELYFARIVEGKQRMVAIRRELPPGLGVARAAVEELLHGEVPRGCDRPLPPGTELLGITVVDGLATVNFSEQLQQEFRGGSDNEQVTVYSVVNTLTSLPAIDRVQFLVGGETVATLGGHHDVSGPLEFDEELVVSHS